MFTRYGITIIAAVALLPFICHAATGAGADEVHTTSQANSVNVSDDAASIPDFDGDGTIGFGDFVKFAGQFGLSESDVGYDALYDLNGDGEIGFSDFVIFAQNFGKKTPSPVVTIPDANLRMAIAGVLGKATGVPITVADMKGLTELHVPGAEIRDLTGLEFAVNLTSLHPYANSISDVSPLSGLTNLTQLTLSDNSISDVSPLSGLTNLTALGLSFNRISDVSALSGLTDLTFLHLKVNSISDLSPLAGLTKLTQLALSENSISDISPLSGLTNLTLLDLPYNNVSDVSALVGLINLTTLNLWDNSISDLSPLAGLTNLTTLNLGRNSISDVSALVGLINLTTLNLGQNSISDVSALAGLTNLTTLNLGDNSISDLSPLVANNGLGAGDEVDVRINRGLSAASFDTHLPALQARGVNVSFSDNRIVVFTDPRIYNDNVFVLPVLEDLAAGDLPLEKYATRFYEYLSDAFDFLIFIPSLDGEELDSDAYKGAFYAGVGNEVQGLGEDTFFNDQWGSAGKLQGAVFFAYLTAVRYHEHSRLVEGPMLHELMHRWANFTVPPAQPHWDFTSANGILGGFDAGALEDRGGGVYSAPNAYTGGWARNLKPYSPIELYLAGLIPPSEVPDLWVAEDGELSQSHNDWDVFTASRVKTYTIGGHYH